MTVSYTRRPLLRGIGSTDFGTEIFSKQKYTSSTLRSHLLGIQFPNFSEYIIRKAKSGRYEMFRVGLQSSKCLLSLYIRFQAALGLCTCLGSKGDM
jgi:hypothetical protein